MKYKNKPIIVDGIRFQSTAEGNRYKELKILERAKKISGLILQPEYIIYPAYYYNGKKIKKITYRADFRYTENGIDCIEDVKGVQTDVFKIKAKMFVEQFIVGGASKFYLVKQGKRKEWDGKK